MIKKKPNETLFNHLRVSGFFDIVGDLQKELTPWGK